MMWTLLFVYAECDHLVFYIHVQNKKDSINYIIDNQHLKLVFLYFDHLVFLLRKFI